MTATRDGTRATTGRAQRVEFVEGEFDAACDVCAVRPSAILVRVRNEDREALEAPGEIDPVEQYAFCAEHQGAADALYHELARA
jgi:hypothetical protein